MGDFWETFERQRQRQRQRQKSIRNSCDVFLTIFKNCRISKEGHPLLRLVEVLGYLARLERVHRAEDDEDHVVEEGHDDREGRYLGRMVIRLFIKIQRMK